MESVDAREPEHGAVIGGIEPPQTALPWTVEGLRDERAAVQAATLGGQPPNPRDIFGQKMEKAKCFGYRFLTLSRQINGAVQGGIPMTATGNGVLSGFRGGQGVFRFLSLNILGGFGGRKTAGVSQG